MKTFFKRKSINEKDLLAAIRHLNRRRVTASITRLSEYLSINETAVRWRMSRLVENNLVNHEKGKVSDYCAVTYLPNLPAIKKQVVIKAPGNEWGFEG